MLKKKMLLLVFLFFMFLLLEELKGQGAVGDLDIDGG
jgi:hypothetical protein